jgi:excisionase family DNA binding protein
MQTITTRLAATAPAICDRISAAEPISIKDATFRLGVGRDTISAWIKAGRLQSIKDLTDGRRRLIVFPPSVRIIAAEPEAESEPEPRLPELHRLIERLRPCYTKETIASLVAIVVAAEMRLIERAVAS